MSKITLFITFLFISLFLSAQSEFQVQSFVGQDGFQFNTIFQKEITKNKKLNYFGFSNVFANYSSTDSLDIDLLNLINYNFHKGIVFVTGLSTSKNDIIPQIGMGYTMDKDRFNLNFFPMFNYSLKQKEVGFGVYTLMEFTPHIKNKLDLYSMLILDSDFNFNQHIDSKQYVRLGFLYNKKINFGLGADLEQKTNDFNFSSQFGAFLGYNF